MDGNYIDPHHNADERYPLTDKEYYAVRQLFGIVSGFENSMSRLEKRARLSPGTWRDMKMISAVGQKCITNLLRTVPHSKLKHILKEIENTHVTVEVRGGSGLPVSNRREKYCYCPEKAIETLIRSTMELNCMMCEKPPKEAKRCPYRRAIEAVFPYELPGDTETSCKFAGYNPETDIPQEGIEEGA